jgi:hypothetical protein
VDGSGASATASIDHFSILVARRPLTTAEVAVQEALPQALQGLQALFPEFTLVTAPELPLLEGLSVPVLVRRRGGLDPVTGAGPFAAPSLISVRGRGQRPPPTAPTVARSSAERRRLAAGTIVKLGVLHSCSEARSGRPADRRLRRRGGRTFRTAFSVKCLDELEFDGASRHHAADLAAITPADTDYNDLRVRWLGGRYNVSMLWPSQTYRFSRIDVGAGGILTYERVVPPVGLSGHFVLESTGDIRVAGTIDLRGSGGNAGDPGAWQCDDCGGAGGSGVYLNSGRGGRGGDFTNLDLAPVPCDQGSYYPTGDGRVVSICKGGEQGGGAILRPYGGGEGGKVWEKASILNLLVDTAASSAMRSPASGRGRACVGAGIDAWPNLRRRRCDREGSSNYVKAAGKRRPEEAATRLLTWLPSTRPRRGAGAGALGKRSSPSATTWRGAAGGEEEERPPISCWSRAAGSVSNPTARSTEVAVPAGEVATGRMRVPRGLVAAAAPAPPGT